MDRDVFASILEDRRLTTWLIAGAAVHLGLVAAGLPGWSCPFALALHLPCPGCGLSRACLALVHGQWSHALALHAFAPVAILAGLVALAATVLGVRTRNALVQMVRRIEQRSAMTLWLLGGLLIYWASRFFLDGSNFRLLAR